MGKSPFLKKEVPLVSVIMPVFNAAPYVAEAINSIIHQTYPNIELIIIDDGSTDNSLAIIQSYKLPQIKVIVNTQNLGLVETPNKAIGFAQGKYISRMDADDVAHPKMIAQQVQFLETHPQIGVVSFYAKYIAPNGKKHWLTIRKPLLSYEAIRAYALFYCPVTQSGIMMRAEVAQQYTYTKACEIAEDYLRFYKILRNVPAITLPKVLLYIREHQQNVSITKAQKLEESLKYIFKQQFQDYNISYTEADLNLHWLISDSNSEGLNTNQLHQIEAWLLCLRAWNETYKQFELAVFEEVLGLVWYKTCNKAKQMQFQAYSLFRKSALFHSSISSLNRFLFWLKCFGQTSMMRKIYFWIFKQSKRGSTLRQGQIV